MAGVSFLRILEMWPSDAPHETKRYILSGIDWEGARTTGSAGERGDVQVCMELGF
jgi:hypothetical protein